MRLIHMFKVTQSCGHAHMFSLRNKKNITNEPTNMFLYRNCCLLITSAAYIRMHSRLILSRAATFTRVNGTISCFCNKRLQNWPTVYMNLST